MVAIEGEPLLAGLEKEAFAEFEQELFKMGDQGRFEIRFGVAGLFVQAGEFEHERLLEDVRGPGDDLSLFGELLDAFFVAAQGERGPFCDDAFLFHRIGASHFATGCCEVW